MPLQSGRFFLRLEFGIATALELDSIRKAAQLFSQPHERLPLIHAGLHSGFDLNRPPGKIVRMALDFNIAHVANKVRQSVLSIERFNQSGSVVLAPSIDRSDFANQGKGFGPPRGNLNRVVRRARKLGRNQQRRPPLRRTVLRPVNLEYVDRCYWASSYVNYSQ